MCGVSALVSLGQPFLANNIFQMTNYVRHRGPDSEGYLVWNQETQNTQLLTGPETSSGQCGSWRTASDISTSLESKGSVLFGHRRLAIIDLSSAGQQPMTYLEERYWITFNGEIYNFKELRNELVASGYKFQSDTDTEVVLAAFHEWDTAGFNRFRGMFAFVIFDAIKQRVVAARDRYGIKPLYKYAPTENSFAFSSEIKQFCSLPQWNAQANLPRVADFLIHGLIDHTSETLFQGVEQILPGQYFEINLLAKDGEKYKSATWANDINQEIPQNYESLVSLIQEKLYGSINLHMRSDVPIGFCLSGGLDSSALVGFGRDISQNDNEVSLHTFSARSEDPNLDEFEWMTLMANYCATEAHYVYPSLDNFENEMKSIIWSVDEPFGGMSTMMQSAVFKEAAKSNIKVILDGQGADEIFGGYQSVFAFGLSNHLVDHEYLKFLAELNEIRRKHPSKLKTVIALLFAIYLPPKLAQKVGSILRVQNQDAEEWINLDKFGVSSYPNPLREHQFFARTVQENLESQRTSTNLPMLLHFEDRMSMAHSVESRVPYLDYDLISIMSQLPHQYLVSSATTKKIFRDVIRGRVPDQITDRKDKIGFAGADEQWMKTTGYEWVLDQISKSTTELGGLFKPDLLNRTKLILDGKKKFDQSIWRVISFISWVEKFNVKL